MVSHANIYHSELDLAILCTCLPAKCIHCIDQRLANQIDQEIPKWFKCSRCDNKFKNLCLNYVSRTMAEYFNQICGNVLHRIGCERLIKLLQSQDHLYTLFIVFVYTISILYNDYFLILIIIYKVKYLIHRHFYHYDFVMEARVDLEGLQFHKKGPIILLFDIFMVAATSIICSAIILYRFFQSWYGIELIILANGIFLS